MGKDSKGKNCGKGPSQRKDKRYSTRFVSKQGKRIEKYFYTLPETRNWPAKAQLRTGELIGLTWDAIGWGKRTLTVNKTLEFRTHGELDRPKLQ